VDHKFVNVGIFCRIAPQLSYGSIFFVKLADGVSEVFYVSRLSTYSSCQFVEQVEGILTGDHLLQLRPVRQTLRFFFVSTQ